MSAEIFNPTYYVATPYAIPPLLIGTAAHLLGLAVLLRERASWVSITFFGLTSAGAVWLLCYAAACAANTEAIALAWIRLEKSAVTFIPSLAFLFVLAVTGKFRRYALFVGSAFIVSALFCLGVLWGDGLVAGLHSYPWGYYARYGYLALPFLAFFFSLMGVGLRLLWTESRRGESLNHRLRLKAILSAISIACVGSVDFLPGFGVPLYPFGYLPIFAFLVLAAWAVWTYRLTDITPAFAAEQILKMMTDPLLVLDREGIIRVANPSVCRLLGFSEVELVGKPVWAVPGNLLDGERVSRALRSNAVQRYQTTFTRGPVAVLLDVSLSSIPDMDGTAAGIVCLARALRVGLDKVA